MKALEDKSTEAFMDGLHLDILHLILESTLGNKFILVVTDSFAKWAEIIAVQDQTAVTCARALVGNVTSRFGCPSMYMVINAEGALF